MIPLLDRARRVPWAILVLLLSGLIVAAIGGWCVASWHELVTPPGFERLQYDASWAFVFAGLALAAHALGLSAVGRWCAAVAILFGAVRLAAYGAPGWIDIHPMAANPWLPYGPGNYNDMGVLTAAVFIALGCALAALGPKAHGPVRSVLASLLAAIALALASVLLFAAWTGGVVASQWLLLTGGERVGALLFVLLAGGVLAGALVRSKDEQRAIRRWTPGIVWFAVFVCALVLWQALLVQEARFIDNSTRLVPSACCYR